MLSAYPVLTYHNIKLIDNFYLYSLCHAENYHFIGKREKGEKGPLVEITFTFAVIRHLPCKVYQSISMKGKCGEL